MSKTFMLIIFALSFLFTSCAGYTPQMRASNDPYFLMQCQKNDPNGSELDLRQCANFIHNQTAKQQNSNNKMQMWGTVLNTVLGAGLIATQVVTRMPINNPFNNTQNQYMPVGYQTNYNPCNQFTPNNSFPVNNQNQYIPVSTEVMKF